MSIYHSLPRLGQCLTLKSASDSHLFLSISSSIITPVLKWHLLYISNNGFSCIFNRNPKFPKSSVHTYLFQRTFQVFVLPSWILNRWFILNPIIFSHINGKCALILFCHQVQYLWHKHISHWHGGGEQKEKQIPPFSSSLFWPPCFYFHFIMSTLKNLNFSWLLSEIMSLMFNSPLNIPYIFAYLLKEISFLILFLSHLDPAFVDRLQKQIR